MESHSIDMDVNEVSLDIDYGVALPVVSSQHTSQSTIGVPDVLHYDKCLLGMNETLTTR